ncbi:hypothetical protein GPM19_12810 [Halomonas sp. ZH2S]|uniref:Uncharacterized protein n=1 Tax=Vreelandella zhuhanensis TaxID=2684210 RepID=A0A7X3KR14_9GAMM|nr:hypothetical protein [Halomonas zhuhanensis]
MRAKTSHSNGAGEPSLKRINSDNRKFQSPGPYSETYEFGVIDFIDWYSEQMQKNLGHSVPSLQVVRG